MPPKRYRKKEQYKPKENKKNNYKSKSNTTEKMQTVEKIYIIMFCSLKMKINCWQQIQRLEMASPEKDVLKMKVLSEIKIIKYVTNNFMSNIII